MDFPTIWPHFFTATIYNWNHLLKENEYKDIIVECLNFLVTEKIVELNAFVIMSNHVHFIWQPLHQYTYTQIQAAFMKYTAKTIKNKLASENPQLLEKHKVNKYDRQYQVWKREPLSIELFTEKAFIQKLNYIHQNPVIAGLVSFEEDYKYSSAKFYHTGINEFKFLTHYMGS